MGQSRVVLHPQVPLPRHTGPVGAVPQNVQAPPPPETPHETSLIAWQVLPAPQQKPGPQPPASPTVHVAVHAPPAHVGVPSRQAAHALPADPQALSDSPATHVVPSQHPPLQAVVCAVPHDELQAPVDVLQA
jgi:hypothetical protein